MASTAALLFSALLPWWRDHGYRRDLYDYGLEIAANGHLNLGERPYVDFTSPIQAGFFGLNWLAESLGGGNYAVLTLGGAVLIVWAAMVEGAAVTVSAASQHTMLATDYQENGPMITLRVDCLVH